MIFAVLLGVVLILGYFLNQYLFSYWTRHGFKQLDPKFFFGDAKPLITLKRFMGEFLQDLYQKNKDSRIVGFYSSYVPALLVIDPKLVQDILIKDFNNFHDRKMPVNETKDPLSGHLFSLPGQKWKDLRIKLSPTFTSGKLKGMLPIMKDCGKVLENYLDKNVKNGVNVFEFRDLMARYGTNIISSVAFGIDNDCINDPDHIFRKMGGKFFETTFMNGIRNLLTFAAPKLFHKVGLKIVDQNVEDFFFSVVKQTVEYRENKNFSRNDFMQLMIQLKNQGFVSADKGEKDDGEGKKETKSVSKIDMSTLVAQVFIFFIAGKLQTQVSNK